MNSNTMSAIEEIFTKGNWYHSFQYDKFKSPGTFDYSKKIKELNIPNLENKSILDVGCSDGYFSYHFKENMNARRVLGVDFNKYDGEVNFEVLKNFEEEQSTKHKKHNDFDLLKIAYSTLGLTNANKFNVIKNIFNLDIEFKTASIYDLSGLENFDVTFCGSLLEHLRDPITAIEQLYFKTNEFCIIDVSNPFNRLNILQMPILKYGGASGHFYRISETAAKLIMERIGFKNVQIISRYKIKNLKYGNYQKHFVLYGEK
jgi:2-polyprenyl-3-methyl-5-hydroxy-6-metoxy-1,4-benzoquinol methylase